jgi:hypothetical protein
LVNYRYRLSRLLIPGGIPDPEIGEVELFLASDREGYVNNIDLPPDPNCLEINCTPTQCVERIGIWSNQALGPLGTEGFFIAGKPDDENRVTVINVGVVCPLTGTPGRSNYALYPQKQGTLELTTPLIPGLPYAEVVRVSPTVGEFLLRYYKTQGLPHAQLGIARSLANQMVDTEELAWTIIGMVGASIRPDANVIYRGSEIDATVSEYVRRACTGLLELMDPGSLPGRRGSIPRFVYSLSSEADIYGPEAEKLQALTEIRVVENCSDCIEVGPNNKRVSREVRDRSCAAVLLALCIAGYGDKATPLAEYLVSRIDSRGRMITGWTDARPLSTSLSLDSPTASGTITAALAILAYSRVDRSYLPHAHRLIESARLYYYTSSWGTDAIDITLGALISRVLVDYADTPGQARAGLTNVIGQAGIVSPTFLALQLELVGDVNLNTTYRAILDNDPTLECGLSLARELSSTSFLGVLDELGPVYRNYLYRIDKTMSRVRGALPTDFGLFSKTAIRSGNLGRILEALVPSISAAYNKPLVVPTAPTKVPPTISGILNWLTGLGYQEVYVTEAWREALHVVGNLSTYGNTTLGTGLLGMPRPSAHVGVLGRWEERINPAPGGVLVIREGNILGTGIIDDTPAVGALVPDDEECNICYWFGICEAPEPYDCLAGQFDFCEFEPLSIYCPAVLPNRPIKIIEVNQSVVYCPGILPDRSILVYCSLSNSQLTSLRPVDIGDTDLIDNLPPITTTVTGGDVSFDRWVRSSFTTGSHSYGYTLNSVTLWFAQLLPVTSTDNLFVRLHEDADGILGDLITSFTNPVSITTTAANNIFTLTTPQTLCANTVYWLVAGVSSGSGLYRWALTNSANETGEPGWSIGDTDPYYALFSGNQGLSWNIFGFSTFQFKVTGA